MSGATVVLLACALACPTAMVLMMLFMRKGHDDSRSHDGDREQEPADGHTD